MVSMPPPLVVLLRGDRRRNQANNNNVHGGAQGIPGVGPYTGVTIAGPSGNIAAGDGGGYGPGTWVNQGSSGTIVVGNGVPQTPQAPPPPSPASVAVPVQLSLGGTGGGYAMPVHVKDQLDQFVRQTLGANLDSRFRLVDVEYAGILPCGAGSGGGYYLFRV